MENYFTVLDTSETSMFPQRFSNHIYYSKQVKIYLAYESVYSIKLSVHGCQSYRINGSVIKIPARRYVIVNNHQPVTCLPTAAERAVSIFFEPRLVRDVYHNLVASDDKLLSDPQVPADPEPCFFEHVYPLDDNLLSAHLLSLGSRFACKDGRRPCGFDIDTFFSLARALILSQQETFRQIRRTRAIKPSTRGELNLNTQITLVDALSVEEISSTFDGVQISVDIPPAQIDEIVEVAHAGVAVEPPVHVFRPGDRQRRGGNNSTGDYTFVSGGGGTFESVALREANTLGNDYEIRFDGNPENRNYLIYGFRGAGTISVPFSVWNIGSGTPDDTNDDRQILAIGVEDGANVAVYDGGASPSDGGPGDMYDRIYVLEINSNVTTAADVNDDGVVDYDDFLTDLQNNGGDLSSSIFGRPYIGAQVIRRLSLVNLTSNSSYVPPPGTVIRINTTKLPTEQDVFEFATPDFELYTSSLTFNFGSVAINFQFSISLSIINGGNSAINISSIDLESEHFSLSTPSLSISPGDTQSVEIGFEPKELGLQTATMTINSNDAAFPQYVLTLEGEGLPPFEPGKINILSRLDIKVDGEKRNDVTDVWGYYDEVSQREFALIGYGIFTGPPNSGLKIIDVTNPSRPVEVAHLNRLYRKTYIKRIKTVY